MQSGPNGPVSRSACKSSSTPTPRSQAHEPAAIWGIKSTSFSNQKQFGVPVGPQILKVGQFNIAHSPSNPVRAVWGLGFGPKGGG